MKVNAETANSAEEILSSMESRLSNWSTSELITFLHSIGETKRRKSSDDSSVPFDEYFRHVADLIKSYSLDNMMQHELKMLDDMLNSKMYFTEPPKHNDFEALQEIDVEGLMLMYRDDFPAAVKDEDLAVITDSHTMWDNVLSRMDNMLLLRMSSGMGLEQVGSDDETPSQASSSKKPRRRQSKKAASPAPVPAGIAALPSPPAPKQPTRPPSRSAKWMNRDAKAARSHVSPSELLRCVLHELEKSGVLVYSVEDAMQQLMEGGQCVTTSQEYNSALGHIRSIDYSSLALEASEEAQKPYGRTATTAAVECCELHRDHMDTVNAQWETQLAQLRETSSYHWTALTQLQGQLHHIIFNLSDMPPAAEMVVNPFAWHATHGKDMKWVMQLSESYDVDAFMESAAASPIEWRQSKSHPFIHPSSLYFGAATAEECLSEKQIHDIDGMIHGGKETESKEGSDHEHKRKRHAKSFYDPTVEQPAKAPRVDALISSDDTFELSRSKIETVDSGACFDFCVDRTNALLNLGHAVVVVDKPDAFDSVSQATTHRAVLLHTIVSRIPISDGNKLPNPVLFVVKLKDLYLFRDALQCKTKNVLLYFGNDDDRETLRSYMTGTYLYSQVNPAIILTHYEAFCADLVHLKEIIWGVTVFDSPWSIFSNPTYQHIYDEITSLSCKYRLLSAANLAHSEHGYLPSLVNLVSVLFPSIWSVLDDTTDIISDTRLVHYIVRLIASLTAVCDENISILATPSASADEVAEYYKIVKLLPYFEWNGIRCRMGEDRRLAYEANNKILHVNEYEDIEIDEELQHITIHLVGVSAARKKVKKSHTKSHSKRHSKSKKSNAVDVGDVVKAEEDVAIKEEKEDEDTCELPDVGLSADTSGVDHGDIAVPQEVEDVLMENTSPDSPGLKLEASQLEADDTPGTTPTHPPRKPPLDSKALQEIIGKGTVKGRSRSTTPKVAKLPIAKKLDPEEEKSRSIFRRGDHWQVIVQFPGRHRYLGSFRTEEEALLAYETALQQRPEAESGTSSLPRASPADASRKKRKAGDVADEIAKMTDDQLYAAIRAMAAPSLAVRMSPHDWNGPEMRPPAYACLQGIEGFTTYVHHKHCILGKLNYRIKDMATKIGCEDFPGISGLLEDVNVHLGFHDSIARRHAKIDFDDDIGGFRITCLHPAGMFIDGEPKYPHDGSIPLQSKTVIQIGCCIFYFTLPKGTDATSLLLLSPLQYRRQLIIAMLSSIKLRVIREPLSESQQEESQEYKTYADITNKLIENVLGSSKYCKSSGGSSSGSKRKQRDSSAASSANKTKNVKLKTLSPPDSGKSRLTAPMNLPGDVHQQQMQYFRPQLSQQHGYPGSMTQQMYHATSTSMQHVPTVHSHAFTPLTSPYLASDTKSGSLSYATSGPSLLTQSRREEVAVPHVSQGFLSNEMISSQNPGFLGGFSVPMSSFDVIHNRLPSADGNVSSSNLPSLVNNATPLTAYSESNSVMTAVNRLAQLPPSLSKSSNSTSNQ